MRKSGQWGWMQRARRWRIVRLLVAMQRRSSTDQTRWLGAALTYYAFLSLIPLLLLGVSVIGFIFAGNEAKVDQWVDKLAGTIPGLGPHIEKNLTAIVNGRSATGIIAIVGLVYTGVDVVQAAQYALGRIFRTAPGGKLLARRVRSYWLLMALGPVALASAVVTALAAGTGTGRLALRVLGLLLLFAVDVALYTIVYRLVTPPPGPSVREHLPGAVFASVGWNLLKLAGTWYVSFVVSRATAVYGTLAAVIGVMAVLYLASRIFLMGAEISAVVKEQRTAAIGVP